MSKYFIIMFSSLLLVVSSINAQGKKSKGPDIEAELEKMTTDLGFTEDEKASVKIFLEKQLAEKKQFRKENDKNSDDYKTKMKELQLKQSDELKAILGDEKFDKYQQIKNEERKNKNKSE